MKQVHGGPGGSLASTLALSQLPMAHWLGIWRRRQTLCLSKHSKPPAHRVLHVPGPGVGGDTLFLFPDAGAPQRHIGSLPLVGSPHQCEQPQQVTKPAKVGYGGGDTEKGLPFYKITNHSSKRQNKRTKPLS